MKKAIIVVAFALASAVASAASITWQVFAAGSKLSDNSTGANVAAYLFEGSLTSSTLSQIATGTWDPTSSGYLYTKNTSNTGAITQAGVGSYENETVSFSMVLFNSSSYSTATEYKYAEVSDVVFTTANKSVAFTKPLSNASWQAVSVPEPTSGLLLLLGMAGLALKRKHA